ncbi:MAG TPA: cation-translocating P-type ATPase [Bacillota bacterium]|nr:cation-translocating P-type ATPase [Bacillota bacterium]HPZ21655.1 cation-translocating P-type ATPase [Bacillota bacterium]HQD19493.1 cation-translocating P-type ATPase [Bacillota bacterium]
MNINLVAAKLNADLETGLTQEERQRRLRAGANILEREKTSVALVFLSQFADTMVLMLLAATLVSAVLGEYADALTIMIIVILNSVLGFIQEYKAERSLEALRELAAPMAQVLCAGEVKLLPAAELVPGDIVFIKAGDRVPADLQIFDTVNLEIDESPFTGESLPVAKDEDSDKPYAYMGCLVTRGRSKGVVVATGMNTEMGKIAHMLEKAEQQPTPLQRRLSRLGNTLVVICTVICLVVAAAGVLRGESLYKMFMAGVSLAVAAIPEGLPAVVTLCLTFGLQRMLRRNAIARKLPAVETLGCATVICSDKTGTLTENRMTAEKVYADGKVFLLTGEELKQNGAWEQELTWLLTLAAVCNGAVLQEEGKGTTVIGDPTDGALLMAAAKAGLARGRLLQRYQLLKEHPFESRRKMMSVVVRDVETNVVYSFVKGAPEVLLSRCSSVRGQRAETERICGQWAKEAYRLLAVAWKECKYAPVNQQQAESDLVLSGIIALKDPPRPQVPEAIRRCLQAGIKPIMITGDHRETAIAIAERIGLPVEPGGVVTGQELEAMSDRELEEKVSMFSVCARVYPQHKMRIVRALKRRGHVVAMTGDGVNDAPAVKEADIGIAMGISGTEVTKEAASLVLADDNFATIVAAVEEGRVIYNNIRRFIRFLLTCNTGEVFTMFFAILLGFPLPLRAIQILWVNLVTDGLPALALSLEPGGEGIMEQPPRPREENIMARGMGADIFGTGLCIGVLTLAVFAYSLAGGQPLVYGQTMALATLISIQLIFSLDCRKNEDGKTSGIRSNLWLAGALLVSYGLLLLVLYVPTLRVVFGTVGLSLRDWGIVIVFSLLPLLAQSSLRRLRAKRVRG